MGPKVARCPLKNVDVGVVTGALVCLLVIAVGNAHATGNTQ